MTIAAAPPGAAFVFPTAPVPRLVYWSPMHAFEITSVDGLKIKATGSTRAALLEAILQGQFALMNARGADPEAEDLVERPFALAAKDFGGLIGALCAEASRLALERKETYDTVKFTLITADQAKGAFVGRKAEGFETPIVGVAPGIAADRNAEGQWEAAVAFTA